MLAERIVHIVDDSSAVLRALERLLNTANFTVHCYEKPKDFLDVAKNSSDGCVILDLRMPELDGLQVQAKLREMGSRLPVIFLTAYGNVKAAVQAMKAGAVDFIEKPFSDQLLLDRVRQALEIDRLEREVRRRREEARRRLESLTAREREVLTLVAAGKVNKEIAAELGLSPKTVEVHRSHVMSKMSVDSLAELIRVAILAGAIRENP